MNMLLSVGIFSFFVSCCTLPICKKIAYFFSILDIPNNSLKDHRSAIPYLGGLALLVTYLLTFFTFLSFTYNTIFFIVGCIITFFIGLYDDLNNVLPMHKFWFQLGASIFMILPQIFSCTDNIHIIPMIFQVFWITALMNGFNLVDIMDGLATTIGAWTFFSLATIAIFYGQQQIALPAAIGCSFCLSFWVHNYPPATIFLGDAGSLLIGTMVGYLTSQLWITNGETFNTDM